MITIPIDSIQTTDLQARVLTDSATVDEYAEAMQAGKLFPPMVVYGDGQENWLADGFHRLSAMLKVGAKTATVDLRTGTREDALWYAVSANKTHGLKRSNADKRKAVLKAIDLRPSLSDRAIAEHVGVDHKTVSALRPLGGEFPHLPNGPRERSTGEFPQFEPVDNQRNEVSETQNPPQTRSFGPPPPPPTRTGKDGKSYPAPPPPPTPAPKSKGPVDSIGREIPDSILGAWQEAEAMRSHLTAVSRLRGEIRRAQEDQSQVFAEVQLNLVHAELDNLYTHLAVIVPHAVCPTCQGKAVKGCRMCKERGYISEHRWKTAVPQQTKDIILATIER